MLTVLALAKLNLTLEVLGKRDDGYHEIRSVVQTIDLGDTLRFRMADRDELTADKAEWRPEQSLVSGALSRLREATGSSRGVGIEVEKRIPLMAGLGGDSSDAAAALRGLNQLWELGLPMERLAELGAQLGSDVPYFLHGGTALMSGRGELIEPLPALSGWWVVLALPPVPCEPGKTKRAYGGLTPGDYTDGRLTERMVGVIRSSAEPTPDLLFNVFEGNAFASWPALEACRRQMLDSGADSVHLVGSGPALFSLTADRAEAARLHRDLRGRGLEVYLAATVGGG